MRMPNLTTDKRAISEKYYLKTIAKINKLSPIEPDYLLFDKDYAIIDCSIFSHKIGNFTYNEHKILSSIIRSVGNKLDIKVNEPMNYDKDFRDSSSLLHRICMIMDNEELKAFVNEKIGLPNECPENYVNTGIPFFWSSK
jgi:hypothetical protein